MGFNSAFKGLNIVNNFIRLSVLLEVMHIMIRTNGAIPKSFRKYLNNIFGKHNIKQTEKTAIIGNAGKLTFPMAIALHAP